MISEELTQVFTGFIGASGFAILYNIRGKKLLATAFGGFISWSLFLLLEFLFVGEPLRYFFVSVIISVYSEIMARLLKTPTTTFIITSLIPLVPGRALYYTMSNALGGSFESFLKSATTTLKLALALALGVVVVTAFTNLLKKKNLLKNNLRKSIKKT